MYDTTRAAFLRVRGHDWDAEPCEFVWKIRPPLTQAYSAVRKSSRWSTVTPRETTWTRASHCMLLFVPEEIDFPSEFRELLPRPSCKMSDVEMENSTQPGLSHFSFFHLFRASLRWSNDLRLTFLSDLVYDPDQDPEEKRAVRKDYRSLAKKIEGEFISSSPLLRKQLTGFLEQQANPNDYTADELTNQVKHADSLFHKGI